MIRFDELEFDGFGQSQSLRGIIQATSEGEAPTKEQVYLFAVRRMQRHIGDGTEEWVYWLVGEDGVMLSSALLEPGIRAALQVRTATREEYDQLSNRGMF